MSFDGPGMLTAVQTALAGLSGLGHEQLGAPQSVGPRVSAWSSLGGHQVVRKAQGVTQRETRILVMFCYRVDGAEATAETTLAGLVDDFMAAIHADLTLGGTVVEARVESPAADEPDYQLRAGAEYREYPVVVTAVQRGTFAVNP